MLQVCHTSFCYFVYFLNVKLQTEVLEDEVMDSKLGRITYQSEHVQWR